ncbi:sensor histidine kinase [Raineyella fluvialis]|uniref:histidine kinase n=1 Tax=Raineyella fluvialis TaxID=2662261 RepID=A0A5Q2FB04_9ACTN|nr:ATP-binding protein [Raineyella fluvialis]QGF22574.1 hypothetical protein Rai3103_01495 [Raineyella fluvialis]
MTEMRRMVAVLRDRNELVGREPPPSLAQVEGLVENFRSAGLPVELRVTGTPRHLAPGLDLAAYRVVQEGLTNVLRHAVDPRRAVVTIDYATDRLELHVRDDGATMPVEVQYGDGLLGLQERVAMNGGTFQAGPLPDRGFELRTTLPLEAP